MKRKMSKAESLVAVHTHTYIILVNETKIELNIEKGRNYYVLIFDTS